MTITINPPARPANIQDDIRFVELVAKPGLGPAAIRERIVGAMLGDEGFFTDVAVATKHCPFGFEVSIEYRDDLWQFPAEDHENHFDQLLPRLGVPLASRAVHSFVAAGRLESGVYGEVSR